MYIETACAPGSHGPPSPPPPPQKPTPRKHPLWILSWKKCHRTFWSVTKFSPNYDKVYLDESRSYMLSQCHTLHVIDQPHIRLGVVPTF